jgi:hypothetical protein
VLDRAAARVHDAYVDRRRAGGFTTVASRHGAGELLVEWSALPDADKADDHASVDAVLESLAREDPAMVWRLLRIVADDLDLLAALQRAIAENDPPSAGLADRCSDLAAGKDGKR